MTTKSHSRPKFRPKPLWPPSVYVATPDLFVFDGPAGCDINNYPQSMTGWLDFEIRNHLIQVQGKIDIYVFSHMYDIWFEAWHQLYVTFRSTQNPLNRVRKPRIKPGTPTHPFPPRNVGVSPATQSDPYNRYDLYNATWALLGYTDNQSPKALQLLKLHSNQPGTKPF